MVSIAAAVGRIKDELGQVLSREHVAALCRAAGVRWRQRVLDPVTTVYVFILQVLHGNTAMTNLPRLSGVQFTPAAYCQARQRLPLAALRRLLQETGRPLSTAAPAAPARGVAADREERWCGHRTLPVDGSSCSMPDTAALRRRFGLPPGQKPGCGFPVAHLLLLFDAHSGALLDVLVSPWHTHDLRRVAELFGHLQPGDVLLADRGFCAYAGGRCSPTACSAASACSRTRSSTSVRTGRRTRGRGLPKSQRGPTKARPAMWFRPQRLSYTMNPAEHAQIPELLVVAKALSRPQPGFRTQEVTLVTTLLDPQRYPAQKLAELYRTRWQVETQLRELKCTLGLSVLHSRTVAGVEKEIRIFGLVYNLVRALIQQATARQNVPPGRVSFIDALRSLRHRLHPPSPPPAAERLHCQPLRPERIEPRYRKRRPPSYPLMTRPRAVLRAEMLKRNEAA